jgi:amidase
MYISNRKRTKTRPFVAAGLAALTLTTGAQARRTTDTSPSPDTQTTTAPTTPKMFDLSTATISDIQQAMTEGSLTSVELVSLYLRRIQAYDKSSTVSPVLPLNSVLFLNPDLLEDAAQADRLRKQGVVLGPLHGIPFLVKGSYSIKDMPISGGTTGWKDLITPNEAWSVLKMRQAGGIVMGHANMDTWANSATNSTSQIKGSVRSAYLPGALPGGSSGGSGVSSGAYLTHFAFGGETGGSIRNPGDRNGLVAYKTSGGSISVDRIIALVPERDVIGPMTRAATDNAVIRDIVGKRDPNDMWNPVLPLLTDKRPVPESGFVKAIQGATLRGKKIGIIGTYVGMTHPNPGEGATTNTTTAQTTTPATLALVQQAKADMEAAGATVNYVFMPPQVSTTYNRGADAPQLRLNTTPYSNQVAAYSYRGLLESVVGRPNDTYSERAAKVLEAASLVTYISSTRREMMYTQESDGTYVAGEAISFASPEGMEHYAARAQQKNAFEAWMDAEGLDAVVWPVWPNKTRTSGSIIGRDLVNFMYLPAVTVPMGKLTQVATTDYPEGDEPSTLNITGRLYDDAKVLSIAYAYEQATKHRYSPPLAPPISGEVFSFDRQSVKPWVSDSKPPVLSVAPTVTWGRGNVINFTGTIADASGVDRLEVSVAGSLIPAVIEGNTWKAVLPAESAANVFIYDTSVVDIVVLAVDAAGNASSSSMDVSL